MKKIFISLIAIIFILVFAVNIITPQRSFSENENRSLSALPDFSFAELLDGELSEKFESYVADQFFARDFWVSAKAVMEKSIGKKDNNGVYFCDDGYFIEVPNYDMEIAKTNIRYIKTDFGIKTDLLLIPTAYEILNDKLPKNAYSDIQRQIISAANGAICPTDILSQHKNEYIYYKTDHHQTALGAYLTYTYWCERNGITPVEYTPKLLANDFYGSLWSKATLPNIAADTIFTSESAINAKVTINDSMEKDSIYDYDKLKEKDKYLVFMGGNYGKAVIDTTAGTGKTAVIFKDSYANALLPYFVNHFDRIVMIDLRYYNQSINELISEYNPDEILYIYSVSTFATDDNLKKVSLSY